MPKTKEVRHEIYDYLISRGFELTHEDRSFLSMKIQEHSDNRMKNLKAISTHYTRAEENISKYLAKAKTLPSNPVLQAQVETLKLVHGWLN